VMQQILVRGRVIMKSARWIADGPRSPQFQRCSISLEGREDRAGDNFAWR
jgi:hypothetical protein